MISCFTAGCAQAFFFGPVCWWCPGAVKNLCLPQNERSSSFSKFQEDNSATGKHFSIGTKKHRLVAQTDKASNMKNQGHVVGDKKESKSALEQKSSVLYQNKKSKPPLLRPSSTVLTKAFQLPNYQLCTPSNCAILIKERFGALQSMLLRIHKILCNAYL